MFMTLVFFQAHFIKTINMEPFNDSWKIKQIFIYISLRAFARVESIIETGKRREK